MLEANFKSRLCFEGFCLALCASTPSIYRLYSALRTVSDKERAEMIRLYVEERLNLEKIVEYFSLSSRTYFLPHSEPEVQLREAFSA